MYRSFLLVMLAVVLGGTLGVSTVDAAKLESKWEYVKLLQPLSEKVPKEGLCIRKGAIGVIYLYFNASWPWVRGVTAGIAILWALIGGIQIMVSGGGDLRKQGIERIVTAIIGLVIIAFAGFILNTINPLFYVEGQSLDPSQCLFF